ncbi:type II toxin-antitoxin system HicB family antitoxin [Deltaproteobacteria bacterium OttesenSCG-928-M10]|nr:type II toxin-antitoxin system HicB family antitoxin [Deltaproteobacteria bacterium OttesenSCG-928-M10]
MKPMTHCGYAAKIEYSDEDACFVGRVAGIQDIITFHGDSVDEIRRAFEEAVDFYIDTCEKRGKAPQKPFSGRLMLRLPQELHARLAIQAQTEGKSLNSLVTEALVHYTE